MSIHLSMTTMWSLYFTLSILIGLTIGNPLQQSDNGETELSEEDVQKRNPNPDHSTGNETSYLTPTTRPPPPIIRVPTPAHHRHNLKPKSTPKPIVNMTLVKEHYAAGNKESVYKHPVPENTNSADDLEKLMNDLIDAYGFDKAIKILEGRVSINLPAHPSAKDLANIRDSIARTFFDYKTIMPTRPTARPHSHQRLSTLKPEVITKTAPLPMTSARPPQITSTQPPPTTSAPPPQMTSTPPPKMTSAPPPQMTSAPPPNKTKTPYQYDDDVDDTETPTRPPRVTTTPPSQDDDEDDEIEAPTRPSRKTTTTTSQDDDDDDDDEDDDDEETSTSPPKKVKQNKNTADEVEDYDDDDEDDDSKKNSKRSLKISDFEDYSDLPTEYIEPQTQRYLGSAIAPAEAASPPKLATSITKQSTALTTQITAAKITTKFTMNQTHLHSKISAKIQGKNETRKAVSHSCPTFANFLTTARKFWIELLESTGFVKSLKVLYAALSRSMKALGVCFYGMANHIFNYFYLLFRSDKDTSGIEISQINSSSRG